MAALYALFCGVVTQQHHQARQIINLNLLALQLSCHRRAYQHDMTRRRNCLNNGRPPRQTGEENLLYKYAAPHLGISAARRIIFVISAQQPRYGDLSISARVVAKLNIVISALKLEIKFWSLPFTPGKKCPAIRIYRQKRYCWRNRSSDKLERRATGAL